MPATYGLPVKVKRGNLSGLREGASASDPHSDSEKQCSDNNAPTPFTDDEPLRQEFGDETPDELFAP
jgi:hypothetical protein